MARSARREPGGAHAGGGAHTIAGATTAGAATTVHPVDEVLPIPQMFLYGLQHVLSMYAGVVSVPLIVGTALELSPAQITYLLSAGLFISGLATMLQTLGVWRIGARLPLVQGTSFAAVATMLAIGVPLGGEAGLRAIYGSLIVAGAIAFCLAPFFTRLLKLFPPVVTGVVITVIGVSLLPVAVRWASGTPNTPEYGSMRNVSLAGATSLIIILIYRFLPGFFSRVAILLGLVLGTLVAIPAGATDFGRIGDAAVFQLTAPFHFGFPTFQIGAIISMLVVTLVIMTETTADILAIGKVVGKPVGRRDVTGGLQADMLSTTWAGVFNGFSVSAFAQNVGLVAVTGIKSRFVVACSGVILLLLGLFPVLGALVALVPLPVLGGAGLALFGTVAASGIRTLSEVEYEGNANLVIVAVALGMGVIPIALPEFYEDFPAWFQVIFDSGISAAAIYAIALNLVFNSFGRDETDEAPIVAEGPAIGATPEGEHGHSAGEREPAGPHGERRPEG